MLQNSADSLFLINCSIHVNLMIYIAIHLAWTFDSYEVGPTGHVLGVDMCGSQLCTFGYLWVEKLAPEATSSLHTAPGVDKFVNCPPGHCFTSQDARDVGQGARKRQERQGRECAWVAQPVENHDAMGVAIACYYHAADVRSIQESKLDT